MLKIFRNIVSALSGIIAGKSAKDIYREDFEGCAATYDSVVTRPLLAKLSEEKVKSIKLPLNAKIVELGCGTGQVTEIFLEHFKEKRVSVEACDLSDAMLLLARKRCKKYSTKTSFVKEDMAEFLKGKTADSIDLVASFWSLEYADPGVVLAQAKRVLNKGGKVAVLVNTRETLSELQRVVTPIVLRNIHCLRNIPPIVVPKNAGWFKRTAEGLGFSIELLDEGNLEHTFTSGKDLVTWMKNGGPCSGFRGALKEKYKERIFELISKETDNRNGLKISFKYLYYTGVKK